MRCLAAERRRQPGSVRRGPGAGRSRRDLQRQAHRPWRPHLLPQHLLPGFGFDDGQPVRVNSVEHTLRFQAGGLQALRGGRVCLLFEMYDADLYGYPFG